MTNALEHSKSEIESPQILATQRVTLVLGLSFVGWLLLSAWLLLSPSVPDISLDVTSTWAHTLTFFWLSFAALGFVVARRQGLWLWTVALIEIGVASEVAQAVVVVGRQGSVSDAIADAAGVLVAGATLSALLRVLGRERALRLVAFTTLASLLLSLTLIVAANPTVRSWWACRNAPTSVGDIPLLSFDAEAGLATELSSNSTDIVCSAARSDALRWVVEFTSETASQDGPTRIVTSSVGADENQVNFHLGQAGVNLSVRVRTDNPRDREWETIEDVIRPGARQRVEVEISDDQMLVWVDGVQRGSFRYAVVDFGVWDPSYPLLAGSEATGDRDFLGTVHSIDVYDSLVRSADTT